MQLSSRDRKNYLKRLKKDPKVSTEEYNRVKTELAAITKEQHLAWTEQVREMDERRQVNNGRIKNKKFTGNIFDTELEDEDFTPTDL